MSQARKDTIERQVQVLWDSGTLTGLTDAQLLIRFLDRRDSTRESAFGELINRHGPMVMGVCRRILRRPHDADDAFQATFLVLVRKARSVRVNESLAPWLYRVATRTAKRARATASRYSCREVDPTDAHQNLDDDSLQIDIRPLLHEELDRLPEKYRVPIVLCHLEGKSHEQAAHLLSWPIGTVSGRLSRGRQLLKSRLERRGLGVSALVLPMPTVRFNIAQSVSNSLLEVTVAAATRVPTTQSISTKVLALTDGVLRAMFLNKLKAAALALVSIVVVSGGVGVWARWNDGTTDQTAPRAATLPNQEKQKAHIKNTDAQPKPTQPPGGTLPAMADGFMGTLGFPIVRGPEQYAPNVHMLKSGEIVVVESPERTEWNAMSLDSETGEWQRMAVRAGTTASPILSNDTMAMSLKGDDIDRLWAFSARTGKWHATSLRTPASGDFTPVLGPGSLYPVGNDFYAFSSLTGKWGTLHLDVPPKATFALSGTDITVYHGNQLYVFLVKSGVWSKGVAARVVPRRADADPSAPQKK